MSRLIVRSSPAERLISDAQTHLKQLILDSADSTTLLLLSGGSAIGLYPVIRQLLESGQADHVMIGQIDERFGPVDHPHSNALKIETETGLLSAARQHGVETRMMLTGRLDAEDEVAAYRVWLTKAMAVCPTRIGILGIGVDGHTAGILPSDVTLFEARFMTAAPVTSYASDDQYGHRMTLTPSGLSALTETVVIAAGQPKQPILEMALRHRPAPPVHEVPAVLLRELASVHVFTD